MGDMDVIKKRLQETYCKYDKNQIAQVCSLFTEDGSFADINYNDKSRANWAPMKHMERCRLLACVYPEDKSLGEYIRKAMEYWFRYDFTCPNWFFNELGVPQQLRIILLNCSDILGEELKEKMLNRLQSEIAEKWTGMNRLWFAENVIFRGVLTEDTELIKKGRDYVAETIFVSEEGQEGVQVDGSFAQHRMQLYNHGYGRGFIINATAWFDILGDTSFAFKEKTVKVITDLYLNGSAKMGRFEVMDFSARGREIVRCYDPNKSSRTMQCYKKSAQILARCNKETDVADKLHKTIDFMEGKRNNPYEECNTAYWCLKFMTHHRNGFYASVRMDVTYEAECFNGENYLGGFGAYGLCMYMRDGKEYEDIFPVLDWGCLPGTTTPHVEMHLGAGGYHESEFVGSVSDGMYGVSAADMYKTYTYNGETASFGGKQAYFFFDECVLHLGADLYSTSKREFHTTLDQCWLKGAVYVDGREICCIDADEAFSSRYVYHNHKAYVNLDKVPFKLKAGERVGSYKRIFVSETAPKQEVKGDTFTLVMPHDKDGASYQYAVFPDTDIAEVEAYVEHPPFEILCNDSRIQAVWYKDALYAVFYEAGDLNLQGENLVLREQNEKKICTVSIDKPCMLIWNQKSRKFYISTPDKSVEDIRVTIDSEEYLVQMPEDIRFRGSSIEVKNSGEKF